MINIRLMCDYQCWPLWWDEGQQPGVINPASLPLAQETVERSLAWAAMYDGLLNWDDPASSAWGEGEQEAFEQEGLALWRRLRHELGPEYHVLYFSDLYHRLFDDPTVYPSP